MTFEIKNINLLFIIIYKRLYIYLLYNTYKTRAHTHAHTYTVHSFSILTTFYETCNFNI